MHTATVNSYLLTADLMNRKIAVIVVVVQALTETDVSLCTYLLFIVEIELGTCMASTAVCFNNSTDVFILICQVI